MAVTINVIPAEIESVYRPIIWEVDGNHFGSEALSVLSVTAEAVPPFVGLARFTFSVAHPYQVGDIIRGSGFLGVSEYNKQFVVQAVNTATSITTGIIHLGDDSTGTMTRENKNYRIRADLAVIDDTNFPTVAIASASAPGPINTRFVTSTPHGLAVGDKIELTGTTTYDGFHEVELVTSTTEFDILFVFGATTTGNVQKLPLIGSIRQQVTVEGGTNLWRFNIAGLLNSQLSGDLRTLGGSGVTSPTDKSIIRYVMFFVEEYNLKPGVGFAAGFEDRIFSTAAFGMNHTNQHREAQDVVRFLLDGVTKRFLTNSPSPLPLTFEEEFQLSFITDDTAIEVKFERFDNNGASIGISTLAATIIRKRALVAINENIFTEAHSRLDIWVEDGESNRISEIKRFDRRDICFKNPLRFHWLNRAGGFDAYTFTGRFEETIKSKKTLYQRDLGITVEKEERGKTVLGVADDPTFKIWSEFLNDGELLWLSELITSPDVSLEEGTDLIPVVITNRSTRVNADRLTQLRLSYSEANELLIQNN